MTATTHENLDSIHNHLFEAFGKNLRNLREELHLNQSDFGERFGLSRVSISNIEKGKQKPPLQFVFEIVKAYNIKYHDLLPHPLDSQFVFREKDANPEKSVAKSVIDQVRNSLISD